MKNDLAKKKNSPGCQHPVHKVTAFAILMKTFKDD